MSSETWTIAIIGATLAAGAAGLFYIANAPKPQLATVTAPVVGAAPPDATAQTQLKAVAQAQPAAATQPPDTGKAPAEAARAESWIGLPVVAADGATIGQIVEMKPSADGKSTVLSVKGSDGNLFNVPGTIATMKGRAIQVSATSVELGKSRQ